MNEEVGAILEAFSVEVGPEMMVVEEETRVLLVGEESHGTHEFYQIRNNLLTSSLIHPSSSSSSPWALLLEIAPSLLPPPPSLPETDDSFPFPSWMWNNQPMRQLWPTLASHHVPVFGMDLYHPDSSQIILGKDRSAQDVLDTCFDSDPYLYINALAILAHERYVASNHSWNVRDQHMHSVVQYLLMKGFRVFVMAHNSHCLDYRGTSHAELGQVSLGQLVKEDLGTACFIVAFTTFCGSVRAAPEWGGEGREYEIEPAASSSVAYLMHKCPRESFAIILRDAPPELRRLFGKELSMRAIGVVYKENDENLSHYFQVILSQACDAIIHIDRTTAVAL